MLRAQATTPGGWPDRPLRLVVPWPAGGGTDIMARIFTPKLGEILGKPVVIENRGGASGSIGAIEALRSPADGYTWMLAFDPEASNQTLLRLPYQLLEAFAPITVVATSPLVLVAASGTPWRSLSDLVAAAKRAPGYARLRHRRRRHPRPHLHRAVAGEGGFKLLHVPYRGGGPATQAALSGEVPLFMTPVPPANQHIRAGTLRPLAVTTGGESRHVPGVKSFAEQGFPGFEAPTWYALLGRAGTPEPILRRMSEAMAATLNAPEVRAKIEEQGADVVANGPDQTRRFLEGEIEKWGRVIRDNNISVGS